MPIIHSRQNSVVKHIVKLKEAKHRKKHGQFIIEGRRELSRALDNNTSIYELIHCPHYNNDSIILEQAQRLEISLQEVSQSVFDKISHRESPDGLLAIAETWPHALESLKINTPNLLLIAEGIEKPGNLGALIRTTESVGCQALILTNSIIDIFNPNVIRASQGLLFSLPIATTDNSTLLNFLKKHNIQLIATTPHTQTPYWECNYRKPSAIVLGSEKDGLSSFWLENSDVTPIVIPQIGQSDSLNVNISGAIVLYEALRQRKQS